MSKEYRIPVYDGEKVVARVRYNANLDRWDGRNWSCGSIGHHLGLTKLQDSRYVLIYGTDWQGERDIAEIISAEEALQAILRSGNTELLDTKKFCELKKLMEEKFPKEEDEQ